MGAAGSKIGIVRPNESRPRHAPIQAGHPVTPAPPMKPRPCADRKASGYWITRLKRAMTRKRPLRRRRSRYVTVKSSTRSPLLFVRLLEEGRWRDAPLLLGR